MKKELKEINKKITELTTLAEKRKRLDALESEAKKLRAEMKQAIEKDANLDEHIRKRALIEAEIKIEKEAVRELAEKQKRAVDEQKAAELVNQARTLQETEKDLERLQVALVQEVKMLIREYQEQITRVYDQYLEIFRKIKGAQGTFRFEALFKHPRDAVLVIDDIITRNAEPRQKPNPYKILQNAIF